MKLYDLISYYDLQKHLDAGNVKRQTHPKFPLAILNYTDKASYGREWDDTTRRCRGLIYNHQSGDVVARPMEKIFNHNEPDAPAIPLDAPVDVTDKIDGSLGILYLYDSKLYVATRGSFTSDQALHATELLRIQYVEDIKYLYPPLGWTHLFEICYPGNRIVLDYGDRDELVYLGSVEIETGEYSWELEGWPHQAEFFHFQSYAEALSAPPRENAEGYVIRSKQHGTVKLKQQDYVDLHKIVFGLNARVVWESVSHGDYDTFRAGLPEEFRPWADGVAEELIQLHYRWVMDIWDDFAKIERMLGGHDYTRKDFALVATKFPYPAPLFMALDGNGARIDEWAWQQCRPDAHWSPR